jgi:hypothetical protein
MYASQLERYKLDTGLSPVRHVSLGATLRELSHRYTRVVFDREENYR